MRYAPPIFSAARFGAVLKQHSPPLYQEIIKKLPAGRGIVIRALAALFGRRLDAQINQFAMKLDLRESIQRLMFLGAYEPEQTAWFTQCLRPGDVVVDVGASFGYYTTLAATLVGPSGKVFAFEPSPIASAVIQESLQDTGARNVVLTKAALGKQIGNVSLFLPTTSYLHSPSILRSDPSFVPIQVPILSLDQFEPLRGVPRIRLVKIDVEGYEPDVLDGMQTLMTEKRVENLICEFNSGWLNRNSTTPSKLLQRIMSFGYQIHRQTPRQVGLRGHHGETYDLQNIWFSIS